jgi:hypothetical protein
MAGRARHCGFIKSLGRALARFCRKTRQKRKPTIEEILALVMPRESRPMEQQIVMP